MTWLNFMGQIKHEWQAYVVLNEKYRWQWLLTQIKYNFRG